MVNKIFDDLVATQCGTDQMCIDLLEGRGKDERLALIEIEIQNMMPTFERSATIRDNTINWLDSEITSLLSPYEEHLKLMMVFFLFAGLKFLGGLFVLLSTMSGSLVLLAFKTVKLIEESTEKVDRITYNL